MQRNVYTDKERRRMRVGASRGLDGERGDGSGPRPQERDGELVVRFQHMYLFI